MKIKFLGTSHGVPERDRRCTSVLFEAGGKHYLIDAGAPIADELTRAGVPFADISAIFLTHLHGDHINGLVHFIDLSNWFYKDSDPLIFTPSLDLKTALEAWETMLTGGPGKAFRYTEITAGEIYADEAIRVVAFPTQHHVVDRDSFKRRSYAFAVTEIATGKRVLFTGDLRPDMCDMPEDAFTVGYDCIITEAAHGYLDKLAPRLAQCKTKQMIISHIYHRTNPTERVETLRAALDEPMTVAEDGQEFEI
ncbi:MAG: MBL fold metallo-hydrolase [Clostridia bacterium]|nr:MBL fold metallo-hydrolase [Clostridia bacterium]